VPAGTDEGSVSATAKGEKETRVEEVEVEETDVEVESEEGDLTSTGASKNETTPPTTIIPTINKASKLFTFMKVNKKTI